MLLTEYVPPFSIRRQIDDCHDRANWVDGNLIRCMAINYSLKIPNLIIHQPNLLIPFYNPP